MAWLHDDDDAYQRVLGHAKQRWRPTRDVQRQDYGLTLGEAMLHLYRSDSEAALATTERFWPAFSKSLIARTQMPNCGALPLRGLAAVAKVRTTGDGTARAIARDCAKRLARLALPFAPAMQSTVDAGLALHAGDEELGVKHLYAAIAGFAASDMAMYAAAVRRRLGELVGGDEGRALLARGDAVMHAQRVKNLDAVTEMLCAGCRAP